MANKSESLNILCEEWIYKRICPYTHTVAQKMHISMVLSLRSLFSECSYVKHLWQIINHRQTMLGSHPYWVLLICLSPVLWHQLMLFVDPAFEQTISGTVEDIWVQLLLFCSPLHPQPGLHQQQAAPSRSHNVKVNTQKLLLPL